MSAARSEGATPLFEGWRTVAHIFFAEYRDHFNRLDGTSIARLWNAPSGVMEGQTVVLWDTRAKVEANHVALCERYRTSDFGSADFEIVHIRPVGDEAIFVHVIWTMRRRDGAGLDADLLDGDHGILRAANQPGVLPSVVVDECRRAAEGLNKVISSARPGWPSVGPEVGHLPIVDENQVRHDQGEVHPHHAAQQPPGNYWFLHELDLLSDTKGKIAEGKGDGEAGEITGIWETMPR